MSQNPFDIVFTTIYNFDYTLTSGLNTLYLPSPVIVDKGQLILLTQSTGRIAIDTSGNSTYSDLVWQSPIWTKLNSLNTNWRFYLNVLTNFTSYTTTFNLVKTYKSIGLYNLIITFNSSNQTFQQTINVTDCKLKINYSILIFYFIII